MKNITIKIRKTASLLSKRLLQGCLALLLLCNTFIFSGCLHALQLNERALVQAVGIDWEDERIKLTLQVFSPAASGSGGGISASPQNANIIESSGRTVTEAFQNASLVQGKEMFIGHNRVIVVGAALAKRGIEQAIAFFSSSSTARHNAYLVIAETEAKEIVTAKINQGILPAETLERILENAEMSGLFEGVKLYEFLTSLQNEHDSAILPVLAYKSEEKEASADEKENKPSEDAIENVSPIFADGMAIFVDGKMVESLRGGEVRGLLWMRNSIKDTLVTVQSEVYQNAALNVYSTKSHLLANFKEGQVGKVGKVGKMGKIGKEDAPDKLGDDSITFTLKVDCQATLKETTLREGAQNKVNHESIADLSQIACELIKEEVAAAFNRTVIANGADVFNLGNIIWKGNKEVWQLLRDDWPNKMKSIKLIVEPTFIIDRVGSELERGA